MLFAFGASAETYRWTDGQGQEHFTSNLQDVPAQYRKAAGFEPEKALIREAQPPASAGSRRVEEEPAPPKQERPLAASEKYEVKCNSAGERCRKIQTQEFRDWKAVQEAQEAQN